MKNFKVEKIYGFSLMELMVTLVIIGILAAIAYPAFTDHLYKTRRSDGQAALMNLATYMEHYYTENNSYTGATLTVGSTTGTLGLKNTSIDGYYTLSISSLTATTYTLTATPTAGGPQAGDTTCTTLTLTNTNIKGATPSANSLICWQ